MKLESDEHRLVKCAKIYYTDRSEFVQVNVYQGYREIYIFREDTSPRVTFDAATVKPLCASDQDKGKP